MSWEVIQYLVMKYNIKKNTFLVVTHSSDFQPWIDFYLCIVMLSMSRPAKMLDFVHVQSPVLDVYLGCCVKHQSGMCHSFVQVEEVGRRWKTS